MISDEELAWRLADAAGAELDTTEYSRLYVDLGSGDCIAAIERILTGVALAGAWAAIRADLATNVLEWLDRYPGYAHERRLRPLVHQLHHD